MYKYEYIHDKIGTEYRDLPWEDPLSPSRTALAVTLVWLWWWLKPAKKWKSYPKSTFDHVHIGMLLLSRSVVLHTRKWTAERKEIHIWYTRVWNKMRGNGRKWERGEEGILFTFFSVETFEFQRRRCEGGRMCITDQIFTRMNLRKNLRNYFCDSRFKKIYIHRKEDNYLLENPQLEQQQPY